MGRIISISYRQVRTVDEINETLANNKLDGSLEALNAPTSCVPVNRRIRCFCSVS